MKKLSMKLDDLRVDSFTTAAKMTVLRGTVRGNYVVSGTSACDFHTWTDNVQTDDCYANESVGCP